jgi:acyl-CoA thioesterase
VLEADVGEDWLQGRSLFGGVQAALGVRALRALVPETLPLRTLQTTFIAPVVAGRVRASARVLRTGGSATIAEARVLAGDETLALFLAVFGKARASTVARTLGARPVLPEATPRTLPFVPGMTPAFMQHFRARWVRGGLPFSGSTLPEASIELDLLDEGGAGEEQLVALADFPPPIALAMLKTPAPGSSLTWMLEFLAGDYRGHGLEGWRIDLEMPAARDGYTHQSGVLWAPDGSAAALSRQTMLVYG